MQAGICSQLLVGFHIRIISVFEKAEFKLIAMYNLFSILKTCKPKLYCSLDDTGDSCTVCYVFD